MILSWKHLKARLLAVLHLDDAPQNIALSLAVGVFISCTPLYGLHTVLAITAAVLFRLNKVATITGAWVNLPWFAPFVYGFSLKVGEFVLSGGRGLEAIQALELREWAALIRPLLSLDHLREGFMASSKLLFTLSRPLLVGTTVVGLVAGVLTYFLTVEAVRKIQHLAHLGESDPPERLP